MSNQVGVVRGHTGQRCEVSGVYVFEKYLDGTSLPRPHPQELREPIAKPNIFPPVRSANKACVWRLQELA
jgi:hypothetical protein